MLAELEAAVRAGNRRRATQLEEAILQRLAAEAAERAAIAHRVRALMAELDELAVQKNPAPEPILPEGGISPKAAFTVRPAEPDAAPAPAPAETEGVVYPVWFGTNRKPDFAGTGFSGERHDRVTRGRVDVFIPE
ncbi:MAG TPA: hypothetical protein VEG34_02815, partial [Thermoanaerobaculia bacterium]|nr:hypothetical protein [Thermoanaerobaculia bacterium]